MKKIFLVLSLVALLAAGCNSSQQATNQPPVQKPVVQNTNPVPTPTPVPTTTTQNIRGPSGKSIPIPQTTTANTANNLGSQKTTTTNCGTFYDKYESVSASGSVSLGSQNTPVGICMSNALLSCNQVISNEIGSGETWYFRINGSDNTNCVIDYKLVPSDQSKPEQGIECAILLSSIANAKASLDPAHPENFWEGIAMAMGLVDTGLYSGTPQNTPGLACSKKTW